MEARNLNQVLVEDIASFYSNPLGFVKYVFPWNEPGTQLAGEDGPDEWQTDILREIGKGTLTPQEALQIAVSSGHGIGKTALVAWIIIWFISTRKNPQIVVTANTKEQLETKTWRELAKWHKLSIHSHWFKWTATKFFFIESPETWYAKAIPWSEHNSEAFAGTHEEHVLIIFDEASAIPAIIWEVAAGAMTTPGAIWICFGNPTQINTEFHFCFTKKRHRWITRQIDSRTAKKTNKAKLQQWIDDEGLDSDFVKVRVRGIFPSVGFMQFIPAIIVERARGKEVAARAYNHAPKVLGVDVSEGGGGDLSTIIKRQGSVSWDLEKYREVGPEQLSDRIVTIIKDWQPDAIFVDAIGVGQAVVVLLRKLGYGELVISVKASHSPRDKDKYYNRRVEMWGECRDWLAEGGSIPDDQQLADDLSGPQYTWSNKDQYKLEKKDDMVDRGLASPDCAEALVHTFYSPVEKRTVGALAEQQQAADNYQMFGFARSAGGES